MKFGLLIIFVAVHSVLFSAEKSFFEPIVQRQEILGKLQLSDVKSLALVDHEDHPFLPVINKFTRSDLREDIKNGKAILYSINHLISQIRVDINKSEMSVIIDPDLKSSSPFGGYWFSAVLIEKTDMPIVYYLRGVNINSKQDYSGKDVID